VIGGALWADELLLAHVEPAGHPLHQVGQGMEAACACDWVVRKGGMPLSHMLASQPATRLADVRKDWTCPWARPDSTVGGRQEGGGQVSGPLIFDLN
jgi:hypothetical protein